MGASSRDLDDWADALDVDNDDDAQALLAHLTKRAKFANDAARLLSRMLADLPDADRAKNAVRHTDDLIDALSLATPGFERHERGMH
ncbi:hypothetical protein AB0P21_14710 [Kribbella sp. NPDC056861]|uniref:hypothetical protein n=1 Tax=Kribbella sp. NPDC056861 TaxID=3154857 RepID=UPI003437A578